MPPACGIAAPSSASDRAPRRVNAPPITQTVSIRGAECTALAISAGTRKTPEPITVPMTSAAVS